MADDGIGIKMCGNLEPVPAYDFGGICAHVICVKLRRKLSQFARFDLARDCARSLRIAGTVGQRHVKIESLRGAFVGI
jgi:hypothetical protein